MNEITALNDLEHIASTNSIGVFFENPAEKPIVGGVYKSVESL